MTVVPAVSSPADPAAADSAAAVDSAAAAVIDVDPRVVDVMFPVVDDDQWPPYPAENVEAVLIAHDLAEIRAVPWFLTNLSRGDIVQVDHDGIGYVGRTVVSRGGHSTVHVLAATREELEPIARALRAAGAEVLGGLEPPMLAIDVPVSASLEDVLEILIAAESVTCAHEVASNQHPKRTSVRTVA